MIYSCLTGSEASSEKASGPSEDTDKEKADHKGGCYERGKESEWEILLYREAFRPTPPKE